MMNQEINGRAEQQGRRSCCDAVGGQPLAMAYVPFQTFDNLYSPEAALCAGTLFADLDKPFCGEAVSGSAYPSAPARTCSGIQCTMRGAAVREMPGKPMHVCVARGGCHHG